MSRISDMSCPCCHARFENEGCVHGFRCDCKWGRDTLLWRTCPVCDKCLVHCQCPEAEAHRAWASFVEEYERMDEYAHWDGADRAKIVAQWEKLREAWRKWTLLKEQFHLKERAILLWREEISQKKENEQTSDG